ncbi:expressed unknown protein [Seminavis robusta]|uniref:Transmembrane protein n=1 Tax=Seminavis robusta TaxID=568900 RepID=A0A9N8F0K8_9STRA|nr:expressed unknown protein [Seminavis robusta]|eukprot:Sro2618_g332780.1 n/a (196) ;mRNA; r:8423-9010
MSETHRGRKYWLCWLLILFAYNRQHSTLQPSAFDSAKTMKTPFLLLLLLAHGHAKELIATDEWQKVGDTDTLPAGLEIRMDLTNGGKWARLLQKEIDPPNHSELQPHEKRCGPSCKERQEARAEKRRAAGFMLREPSHHQHSRRRQQETDVDIEFGGSASSSSLFHAMIVFVAGLGIGLGVATRFRRKSGSLHES